MRCSDVLQVEYLQQQLVQYLICCHDPSWQAWLTNFLPCLQRVQRLQRLYEHRWVLRNYLRQRRWLQRQMHHLNRAAPKFDPLGRRILARLTAYDSDQFLEILARRCPLVHQWRQLVNEMRWKR